MEYAIFFSVDGTTVRIPTNPEEVQISSDQGIEEFDILKLGKIAVPSSMELIKYSFEAEFPSKPYSYVVTPNEFKPASFYIQLFSKWRTEKKPIRFVASNEIDDISELVLIESINITEKVGEEGDYYISFELKQYRPYSLKTVSIDNKNKITTENTKARSVELPKPQNKIYTVMQGDTLWSIAKKYLGDGSKHTEIHSLNQPPLGKNPNLIYPGQKIKIPEV